MDFENTTTVRGRVITEHKASYVVSCDGSILDATLRGIFHEDEDVLFPKVGDYVQVTILEDGKGVIESVEERKSIVMRKSAHDDTEQIMVANVDFVFVVMGMDDDFNLRRLERYLVLSEQAHITPVIILNKADIATDVDEKKEAVLTVAQDTPVHVVSAKTGEGMEVFAQYLTQGATGVLLGSSGAGKSTITNYLLQSQVQETRGVRDTDSRGRHTTTVRELFQVDTGGYLIDTPGMRELGFVSEEDMVAGTFSDIEILACDCKFSNCDHVKSAGCAVQAAIEQGALDNAHFQNYLKLQARQAETRNARKRD
jgi:ribosome biogenesis GTPase